MTLSNTVSNIGVVIPREQFFLISLFFGIEKVWIMNKKEDYRKGNEIEIEKDSVLKVEGTKSPSSGSEIRLMLHLNISISSFTINFFFGTHFVKTFSFDLNFLYYVKTYLRFEEHFFTGYVLQTYHIFISDQNHYK